jgi:hypothetical protein
VPGGQERFRCTRDRALTAHSPFVLRLRLCRDTLSENLEGKTRDLFEEIGIENDEAAGCEYRGFEQLVQSCKRRRM